MPLDLLCSSAFSFAREHEHYAAGDMHVTVDIEGLRCSLFVCYDLRFADDWWVVAPQTDLYLCVANWPEPRRAHWSALLRARAPAGLPLPFARRHRQRSRD